MKMKWKVVAVVMLLSLGIIGCAGLSQNQKIDLAIEIIGDIKAAVDGVSNVIANHGKETPEALGYIRDALAVAQPVIEQKLERLKTYTLTADQQKQVDDLIASFNAAADAAKQPKLAAPFPDATNQ